MRKISFLFCVALLICTSACSTNEANSSGDFYTWVDERGQLRTVKKSNLTPKDKSQKSDSLRNTDKPRKDSKITQEGISKNQFNEADFTPSEDVDKKLRGERFYAWNDGGKLQSQTVLPPLKEEEETNVPAITFKATSYRQFREGNEVLISELLGRQIKLQDVYLYSKIAKSDYLLLELDLSQEEVVGQLRISSFVHKEKVALPNVVFLDDEFNSVSPRYLPFNDFEPETWSTYAKFKGDMRIPQKALYLLITPNQEAGVAEVGEAVIKMIDLGVLLIE